MFFKDKMCSSEYVIAFVLAVLYSAIFFQVGYVTLPFQVATFL